MDTHPLHYTQKYIPKTINLQSILETWFPYKSIPKSVYIVQIYFLPLFEMALFFFFFLDVLHILMW
jgi:hypothetical protein